MVDYARVIEALCQKLTKINSNRADGYNNGVVAVMSKIKKIYTREALITNVGDEIAQFVCKKTIGKMQLKPYEEGFNEGLNDSLLIVKKSLSNKKRKGFI